ncbi:Lipin/Ned1/Smp2-domain-containing protein, partial [Dichotomocladium elegans]
PPYLDIGASKDDQRRTTPLDQEDEFDENDRAQNTSNYIDKVPMPAELQSPKMIIEEQLDKVVTKVDPYHKLESIEQDTENLSLDEASSSPTHDTYPLADGSVLLEQNEDHHKRATTPKEANRQLEHANTSTVPLDGDKNHDLEEKVDKEKSHTISEKSGTKEAVLDTKLQLEPGVVYRIEMSLCGLYAFTSEGNENSRIFDQHQITYEKFVHNPNILNDRYLVFRYEGRYFGATHKGPLFTSLFLFHEPLSEGAEYPLDRPGKALDKEPDSRESYLFGRGWRQWWSQSSVADAGDLEGTGPSEDDKETVTRFTTMTTTTSVGWVAEQEAPGPHTVSTAVSFQKNYAKTLRLTSEQLKSLGLKKGPNTITYSVTSAYQGTASCTAQIFFWDYDIQIVISDIDGTITKSDALGHVFTMIGKDWTHNGVAKLYTDIRNNGYHILYLTSRAIGQADYTRNYLKQVEQGKYTLPDGPVIMSPDRLFTSFHREVIMRKPEVFKMACLRDVLRLFGDYNPFYAGFGNRITDAISYRSVEVPASRIFTIDPNGNVKLELLLGFLSSYIHLNDLVDQIFPPINRSISEEYSDWNYWKQPLPKIDIPELSEDTRPPPTSPKPVPIKPDPSKSLPASAVVESDVQKRRTRGILRSFTSRSSTSDSARAVGIGYHYHSAASSPSLVRKDSIDSSGRTSPDAVSIRSLDAIAAKEDESLSSPESNPTTPPSEHVSPVPSTSSSSSIVNRVITGGFGGMRTTLSRTFATRKSSLAEELPSSPATATADNRAQKKQVEETVPNGDINKEPNFDMDDEDVEFDMDSIPFI